MPYALFRNDQKISGPFSSKSEAWDDAASRGFVNVIPSRDEDPPRRSLDFKFKIAPVEDRRFQQPTSQAAGGGPR